MTLQEALACVQSNGPMDERAIVEFFQNRIDSVEFDNGVKLDRSGQNPHARGCYVQYQNSAFLLSQSVHYEVIKANAIRNEQRERGLYVRLDDERNREDDMRRRLKEVADQNQIYNRTAGGNTFQLFANEMPIDCGQDPNSVLTNIWNGLESLYNIFNPILEQFGSSIGGAETNHQSMESAMSDNTNRTSSSIFAPHNLIYFGAPGTGKSHELNRKVNEAFSDHRYERVTFYPTYSYAQFVGCYKPVMNRRNVSEEKSEAERTCNFTIEDLAQKLKQAYDVAANAEPGQTAAVLLFAEQYIDALNAQGKNAAKSVVEKAGLPVTAYTAWLAAGIRAATFKAKQSPDNNDEEISYKFVPGPFLRLLVKALNDPDQDYCLVIEEINRANAAAVFGDVFQLLDRSDNGESEYEIAASEDIKKFLKEKGIAKDNLRVPANMYIWATMNSADQGVFPMDTAFKRRWAFKYIGIDNGVTDDCKKWTIEGSGFLWNAVRTFLNDRLADNGVNEDKLMGPWFVKPENGTVVSLDQFRSKVLMYLWEDAARMCRRKFFNDEIKTYSALVNGWPSVNVFKGIENWDEVKAKWIPSGPGAGMDDAGTPEGTAEPQTEAMPAATSTRTETPPSE